MREIVDATRLELKQRFDTWEQAHDVALAATLALQFADEIEDDVIAAVTRRAKVLVDGQLRAPLYTRLFAEAPSEVTRGGASDEQGPARRPPDPHPRDERRLCLAEGPGARAARGPRRGAGGPGGTRAACRGRRRRLEELQIAEQKAREAYRDAYPKLLVRFPGEKRLVESFFPQASRKRKKAQGEPSTVPDAEGADSDTTEA